MIRISREAEGFLDHGVLILFSLQDIFLFLTGNPGLYVLEPNYVRGCYLEGVVKNADTDQAILNATVRIEGDEVITNESSKGDGSFKMGKAISGTYTVHASHPEYFDGSVDAVFQNGVVTEIELKLVPKPKHTVSGIVVSEKFIGPAPDANVVVMNDDFMYESTTNSNGIYVLSDVIEGTYRVYAGNWGEYFIGELNVEQSGNEDIIIRPGYYDDFHFDYGWSTSGTASQGHWVRDEPIAESLFGNPCNPGEDVDDDIGFSAVMTGNLGGDARNNSVEDGFTMLSSPVMDMTDLEEPVLQFRPWLCVRFTDVQVFTAWMSNGTDTVLIDSIAPDGNYGFWRETVEYSLKDRIELTENMKVHFMATNESGSENLVKAAVDAFVVFGEATSAVIDPEKEISFTTFS